MSMSGLSRSTSATPSSDPMTPSLESPSTRRSAHRLMSGGLRHFVAKHRVRGPEFEMLTPPSHQVTPASPPPTISKLAKAFVDSLTARQLSNFLVWALYYDVVESPTPSDSWYDAVEPMQMHGWIALGDFLSKFSKTMDTGYGLDLVVLDAICDRMQLQRSTVHSLLIQFADPVKMNFSTIASIVNSRAKEGKPEIEVLQEVQAKLQELHKLASHLKPEENTIYNVWHAIVLKRLRGFFHAVIEPRTANLLSDKPLITAATNENLPKEVKDGIKLKYMYEVIQLERNVPLHRYGMQQNVPALSLMTPPSSPPDAQPAQDLNDAERAPKHGIQLMEENHQLRAQVTSLRYDLEKLHESNNKLARKVATLARTQPLDYQQPPEKDEQPTTPRSQASSSNEEQEPNPHLQVPHPRPQARPRPLSHNAGEKLTSDLQPKLHTSSHKRQHSEILSWIYHDVFTPFETPPSPPIRLSNPISGELLDPSHAAKTAAARGRGISYGAGAARRSGMVFTEGQKELLAAIREGTPQVSEEGGDGEDVNGMAEMGISTPVGWRRSRSQ
ncbi:hypothetical protein EK21DRAFT_74972 [Setomelanomma holmii]|uniref:Uncharacterized protein n=1 Tax=Setomelanomma holmii TaxID=210430 RepID=A0A9P4LI18_9PLEO|nr:hypothetical protein EK21DRAFT_74972 [Setomelanomma holmii]